MKKKKFVNKHCTSYIFVIKNPSTLVVHVPNGSICLQQTRNNLKGQLGFNSASSSQQSAQTPVKINSAEFSTEKGKNLLTEQVEETDAFNPQLITTPRVSKQTSSHFKRHRYVRPFFEFLSLYSLSWSLVCSHLLSYFFIVEPNRLTLLFRPCSPLSKGIYI